MDQTEIERFVSSHRAKLDAEKARLGADRKQQRFGDGILISAHQIQMQNITL